MQRRQQEASCLLLLAYCSIVKRVQPCFSGSESIVKHASLATLARDELSPAGLLPSSKHVSTCFTRALSPVSSVVIWPCVVHQVRVLGEGFTPEDEEDSAAAEVSKVWAYQARYRVPLAKATAGAAPDKYLIFVWWITLCLGPY